MIYHEIKKPQLQINGLIINFRKTGIASILTRNDQLSGAYLLCMSGHKVITSIQIFKGWISIDLSIWCNTLIRQYIISFLLNIEKEVQSISRIEHTESNKIIGIVIIL